MDRPVDFPVLTAGGGPIGLALAFLTAVDGRDLWRLKFVGRDPDTLERMDIALVRRGMGCDVPFAVEDKTLWVRKRTVADRFTDGRVFPAGDAAHAHPPNGAGSRMAARRAEDCAPATPA